MSIKQIVKNAIGFTYYNLYRRYCNIIGNRVILYHSIGSELSHDTYGISISKEKFVEHIQFLKNNYEIIPIDFEYKNNLDRNTISITFDDGYKDNLFALEVCKKYDIPFTLYITTGFIGEKDYLSEDDIKEFSKYDKCILGTHSVKHPHLETLSYDEQYYELSQSKLTLEKIIGQEIVHMSYPHGSYNTDTLKIANDLGYKIITSSNIGVNTNVNLDLQTIKRIEIIATDTIENLQYKISGFYDYLSLKNKNLELK